MRVDDMGELDMAHPTTLADFVRRCVTRAPGRRTALVLLDHGGGCVCCRMPCFKITVGSIR